MRGGYHMGLISVNPVTRGQCIRPNGTKKVRDICVRDLY
jgi:hypothetical protein